MSEANRSRRPEKIRMAQYNSNKGSTQRRARAKGSRGVLKEEMMQFDISRWSVPFLAAAAAFVLPHSSMAAWEPSKTVEFIVPAGTGGGADQMARFIQGIIAKHKLMKQPMVVINKA